MKKWWIVARDQHGETVTVCPVPFEDKTTAEAALKVVKQLASPALFYSVEEHATKSSN